MNSPSLMILKAQQILIPGSDYFIVLQKKFIMLKDTCTCYQYRNFNAYYFF